MITATEQPSSPPARIVTAGETMALVTPTAPGRLRHAASLSLSIGGAESNVAIGLTRLGFDAVWLSALGDDELGELVLNRLRAEGVDTSAVLRRSDRPTGLYLREIVAGTPRVSYYRSGSAASTLAPGAFDPAALAGAAFLHMSGITAALSPECAEFLTWLAQQARAAGVRVSFDVNYRSRLWSADDARVAAEAMFPYVDLLLVGHDEARALWDVDEDQALSLLADRGPAEVVLKRGSRGSAAVVAGERVEAPGFTVVERDPIGAGDAFAAGYLAGTLWGQDLAGRLRTANAVGAWCVQTDGDYEGLPSRRELTAFLDQTHDLGR